MHDQMIRLIFLCHFLASFSYLTKCNSSHLETLLRFCMEMFKYSEFDLERTTTKFTIVERNVNDNYYRLHFSRFPPFTDVALCRNLANTTSDSSVLIAGSFLLQFTKLVIGLPKSVMGAIKNSGHPCGWFLAAFLLCSRSKNSLSRQATCTGYTFPS